VSPAAGGNNHGIAKDGAVAPKKRFVIADTEGGTIRETEKQNNQSEWSSRLFSSVLSVSFVVNTFF
jgi:hypothetical protein